MSQIADIPELTYQGAALDTSEFGRLRESTDLQDDPAALRARMAEDGYLFIRGLLDRDAVMQARLEVMQQLADDGKLDPSRPVIDGIPKPGVQMSFAPNYVKGAPSIRRVLYGERMMRFFDRYWGEPALHYDYTWFRCKSPGHSTATKPHYDIVYMGRGERDLAHTVWVPYGDVPMDMGGLIVLEGSHKHEDLRADYGQHDVDSSCRSGAKPKWDFGSYSHDIRPVQQEWGGRWLGADYRAGDVLIFSFFLMHASTDNNRDSLRLSSDSRYQVARGGIDDRWFGENPSAHGEKSHRELIC